MPLFVPLTGPSANLLFQFFLAVIMTENFKQGFYAVDSVIALVAQHYDGGAVLYQPCKHAVVAMPPAVVVNDLFAGRVAEHPPAEAIVPDARLFKTIGSKS